MLATNAGLYRLLAHLTSKYFTTENVTLTMDTQDANDMWLEFSKPENVRYFTCISSYLFMPKQIVEIIRLSMPTSTPTFCRYRMEHYVSKCLVNSNKFTPKEYTPYENGEKQDGIYFWKDQSLKYYRDQSEIWNFIRLYCKAEGIPHFGVGVSKGQLNKLHQLKYFVVIRSSFESTPFSGPTPFLGNAVYARFQCINIDIHLFNQYLKKMNLLHPKENKSYEVSYDEQSGLTLTEKPWLLNTNIPTWTAQHSYDAEKEFEFNNPVVKLLTGRRITQHDVATAFLRHEIGS